MMDRGRQGRRDGQTTLQGDRQMHERQGGGVAEMEMRQTPQTAGATYYNRPMIKKPTWRWFIPFYFFIGGVGGGVALIGGLADLIGGQRHRATVRRARYIALGAAMISPLLLIIDLGRPQRFHHMMRVFKASSPLSVGTWVLLSFGLVSGAQAAHQAAEDNFILRRESWLGRLARLLPSKPLSLLQAALGVGLGGYTGILLAATAIPLWATAGVLLGPFFLATTLACGAAALALTAVLRRGTPEDDKARAEIQMVATISGVAQIGLEVAREAMTPPTIGKPLRSGTWGMVYRIGAVGGGMLAPVALRLPAQLRGRPMGRAITVAAASLTLAGGLAERFAIVEAGKQSADDPEAYQEFSAGQPGAARPTPQQQALMAPKTKGVKARVAASDTR